MIVGVYAITAIFAVSAGFGAFLLRSGVVWPMVVSLIVFSLALPVLVGSAGVGLHD